MTTVTRQRLARWLAESLGLAERMAVEVDGGLGQLAVAAIAALPHGPARDLEIARWVCRATSTKQIATLVRPAMTEAEYEATVDLHRALSEACS